MTLIAEDLLLLLLDDDKGTVLGGVEQLTPVLGGALLMELALADAVRVGEKPSLWSKAKVYVGTGSPPADPLLRDALRVVGEKERSAQDLVTRLGKGLRDQLAGRLAEAGILERRHSKILGVFPRTTWPAADRTHEEALRRDLTSALVEGATLVASERTHQRTAAIIALLVAIDRAHKTVPHEGLSNREVKQRAKAVARGNWAAKAVKDAVDAAAAATMAAVTIAATAAATGSGS